jgi:hypothetical protein
MPLSNDSKEFIALLNSHGVEYLIVGAHSLAFHARPRFTGDLDILIRPTPENATKIVAVLNKFGFGSDFKLPFFSNFEIQPNSLLPIQRFS